PANAINPPGKFEPDPILPDLLRPPVAGQCPNGDPAPCPEVISADDPGTFTVNYRNEPIALRVRDPATNTQAPEPAGDLSLAFGSNVSRADADLNAQPGFYPPLTSGLLGGDPFTPMMRVYEGDRVQVRVLVGAHEEGHNFSIHGQRWLFEVADSNSGFRNSQAMGISEHFEFAIPQVPGLSRKSEADFLYRAGSSVDDLWNGLWGLMRVYRNSATNLL
ncbi:MAG: copper oxidase, partial [Gemmatimonadetes bacterium]|nr:copper oxidase [Gemmatimonadota bacterium]NIT67012.1 copper oxidase [Gemmatimonadota bacterium]NIU52800.1 copper oxidase [Gemmatimonadota bacterium]NIV23806.1 copper oxidase [Gemmatimonadota bacterium]NIY35589.1 copper oxidase [Gemmatimonadota bacterium]